MQTRAFYSLKRMPDNVHYLSSEKFQELTDELKNLKMVKRRETAAKIESAKALGDLSENAEYHEAKNEMAFIEGRVQEIESILKNYSIIETGGSSTVRVGSTIEAEAQGKSRTYKIVGSNEADPAQGFISNESPIGKAFLGHNKGETVEVATPNGTTTYKIISVS